MDINVYFVKSLDLNIFHYTEDYYLNPYNPLRIRCIQKIFNCYGLTRPLTALYMVRFGKISDMESHQLH